MFGLVALSGASVAPAQAVDLETIVQAALDHSYARRLADQAVVAAGAREEQAIALGRPSLNVAARGSRYDGLEESTMGALTIPELPTRYSAAAMVVQPLYTGGRISGQREAEKFARQAAEASRTSAASDVVLTAVQTYWGWAQAFHAVLAAQAAVDRMQALHDDLRHQFAAGMVTENDLLATEVELERARLKHETAQQQLNLARARIGFLTGSPFDPANIPQKAPDPSLITLAADSDLIAIAYSNRSERTRYAAEVNSAAAQIKARQADRRPTVNLRAGYEYANPNQLFFPPEDEWNDDAFVGLDANWNLWDSGLTRSRIAEAAAQRMQAELRRDRADETIMLDVREARIVLEEALNRYAVTVRAQDSARRNVDSSTTLWKNGMARQSDVLDAQARLADADQAVIAAVADVAVGRAALDHACGILAASKP